MFYQDIFSASFCLVLQLAPMSKNETLFHVPGYSSIFFEQFILLNWRIDRLHPQGHMHQSTEKLPSVEQQGKKGQKKLRKVSVSNVVVAI